MAKTKDELNEIKDELVSLTTKLQELNDEEIQSIVGGSINDFGSKKDIDFDFIPAPGSIGDITKRIFNISKKSVFSDNSSGSTFKDENFDCDRDKFTIDSSNESRFKE